MDVRVFSTPNKKKALVNGPTTPQAACRPYKDQPA